MRNKSTTDTTPHPFRQGYRSDHSDTYIVLRIRIRKILNLYSLYIYIIYKKGFDDAKVIIRGRKREKQYNG